MQEAIHANRQAIITGFRHSHGSEIANDSRKSQKPQPLTLSQKREAIVVTSGSETSNSTTERLTRAGIRVNRSCKIFFSVFQNSQLFNFFSRQDPVSPDLLADRIPATNLPDSAVTKRQNFRRLGSVVKFFWFRFHARHDTARDNEMQCANFRRLDPAAQGLISGTAERLAAG